MGRSVLSPRWLPTTGRVGEKIDRSRLIAAEAAARRFDGAVAGALALLVILSPLAFGSVHPWAYCLIEATVFVLVLLWMSKVLLLGQPVAWTPPAVAGILAPIGVFLAIVVFGLVPIPPAAIRMLSRPTWRLYADAFPGWPGDAASALGMPRWLPLSVSPPLTRAALLFFIACAALFFLIVLYPLGTRGSGGRTERRFFRIVLGAVLCSGLLIATLALIEQATWNGKLLWFFVPYDWGQAHPELGSRAHGPFVDPDHLAGYLNLILPLAIAGALMPTLIVRRGPEWFRMFCLLVAIIAGFVVAMSLSRAGWIAAIIGLALLVWLCGSAPRRDARGLFALPRRMLVATLLAAAVVLLLGSSLLVGEAGRTHLSARVNETVTESQGLGYRLEVWKGALRMVSDFAPLGAGFGCFQEVFPRYQGPTWPLNAFREAHNDYLELAAETGIIGTAAILWFLAAVVVRIRRSIAALVPDAVPIAAAAVAAVGLTAFEELFDFDLQIPAIAILLTILLAIALRMALAATPKPAPLDYRAATRLRRLAPTIAVAAAILAIVAIAQGKTPYPYDLAMPATPDQARAILLSHPAAGLAHLKVVDGLGKRLSPAERLDQLRAAALLDPTNPYIRDRYAQSLVREGQPAHAMAEVTRSLSASPLLGTHFYLEPRLIPQLNSAERDAVEAGLKLAVARGVERAAAELGDFYAQLGRYSDQAALLDRQAAVEREPGARMSLLIGAGVAHAHAGELGSAETALRQAAALAPWDPRPYQYLAVEVYARRKDMRAAEAAIREGVAKGADAFTLYLSLADGAQTAGDANAAEAAMLNALTIHPHDYGAVRRIAELYTNDNRLDRAILWLRKATTIQPGSADAYYHLALTEQAAFQYSPAGRDFRKALELAPDNEEIRSSYQAFEKKLAASEAAAAQEQGN